MIFQNIYDIRDTKSAQEFREKLRLGCGLQCVEPMRPLGPKQRPKLFVAALKLLKFALTIDSVKVQTEAEQQLRVSLAPVSDEHVLATLSCWGSFYT